MFKKGDLFNLNKHGIDLFKYISGSIGIIVSDPSLAYEYDFENIPEKTKYFVYDILVSGQLFKDIPQGLLERIVQNDEEDIK